MADSTTEQRRAGAEVALSAYQEDVGERQFTGGEEWIGDLVTGTVPPWPPTDGTTSSEYVPRSVGTMRRKAETVGSTNSYPAH